jgi:hypothetical protein
VLPSWRGRAAMRGRENSSRVGLIMVRLLD